MQKTLPSMQKATLPVMEVENTLIYAGEKPFFLRIKQIPSMPQQQTTSIYVQNALI